VRGQGDPQHPHDSGIIVDDQDRGHFVLVLLRATL
jgi:hypothetical protein